MEAFWVHQLWKPEKVSLKCLGVGEKEMSLFMLYFAESNSKLQPYNQMTNKY